MSNTGVGLGLALGEAECHVHWTLKGMALVFAVIALCAVAGLVVFAGSIERKTPGELLYADGIVVLTGGELRVREGMRLLATGRARRLLISGVNVHTTRDELRRISGLDPLLFDCCVDIGYIALDTFGNAQETRAWARTWDFKRVIVVTSNYHMPRGLIEIGRVLPNLTLIAHPVVTRAFQADSWWRIARSTRVVVSEYLKYLPSVARYAYDRATTVSVLSTLAPDQTDRDPLSLATKF